MYGISCDIVREHSPRPMRRHLSIISLIASWASFGATFAETTTPGPSRSQLPVAAHGYTETVSGTRVTLDYFAPPVGPGLVFGIAQPDHLGGTSMPIDEQARVLQHLLRRMLSQHPDLPSILQVRFGDTRQALIEELDRRLLAPGADWNAALGMPRHGVLGAVLKHELDQVLRSSPIARAFSCNGYALELIAIGRIDIQPISAMHGARLPSAIDVMALVASKTS